MTPKEKIIEMFGEFNIFSYYEDNMKIKFQVVCPIIPLDWILELKKEDFANTVECFNNFIFIEKKVIKGLN